MTRRCRGSCNSTTSRGVEAVRYVSEARGSGAEAPWRRVGSASEVKNTRCFNLHAGSCWRSICTAKHLRGKSTRASSSRPPLVASEDLTTERTATPERAWASGLTLACSGSTSLGQARARPYVFSPTQREPRVGEGRRGQKRHAARLPRGVGRSSPPQHRPNFLFGSLTRCLVHQSSPRASSGPAEPPPLDRSPGYANPDPIVTTSASLGHRARELLDTPNAQDRPGRR